MISVKNYVVFYQKIYIIGVIPISEHRAASALAPNYTKYIDFSLKETFC